MMWPSRRSTAIKVLTILNHGTANSSSDADLVVSRLAELLLGHEGRDWILNEGAGTDELFARDDIHQGQSGLMARASNVVSGIVAGKGVEPNVARAVKFVTEQTLAFGQRSGGITVNLAGHSRGSITCYKIARALREGVGTANIPVNVFAIDPVPGNMGTLNKANYKNIALGGNLVDSFLILAESEHRLAFRPYVDALYSMGLPNHGLDTMPGTHGGINELAGPEKEAASLVMSRAVEFLDDHDTPLKNWSDLWKLSRGDKLETYAQMMRKIRKYQGHASMWNPKNLLTGGLVQVDLERTAVVHGSKGTWGSLATPVLGGTDPDAAARTRDDHRGMKLNEVLSRAHTLQHQAPPLTRAHRFFANLEHQTLFGAAYPNLAGAVIQLERGVAPQSLATLQTQVPIRWGQDSPLMSDDERSYYSHWLARRACPVP